MTKSLLNQIIARARQLINDATVLQLFDEYPEPWPFTP